MNTEPISATTLAGKIVLIDFCTYSCINWLRTLPYIRAWSEKYKDRGLVVIGIHTPEFEFENNLENVRPALKTMKVDYPIAIDNDRSIWNAFDNQYWPALYLLDSRGRIQYHRFGEGDYIQSEKTIQQLLSGTGAGNISHELVSIDATGIEAAADWNSLGSGENYLGYQRTENFSSPGGQMQDKHFVYNFPKILTLNQWALSGDWTVQGNAILLDQPNGQIGYQFHARDLHIVMGSADKTKPIRFKVLIDGQQPGAAHGIDINEDGLGSVAEPRLYQLIRQPGHITDRRFTIEFSDPGLEAFSFTFG
ncbi:MAG TPA: redoxin domain-containing protein [Puia sp.]|nr:redoxin domain-containing protein [Puia sp.]